MYKYLLLFIFVLLGITAKAQDTGLFGDLNRDGKVDASDVTLLVNVCLENYSPSIFDRTVVNYGTINVNYWSFDPDIVGIGDRTTLIFYDRLPSEDHSFCREGGQNEQISGIVRSVLDGCWIRNSIRFQDTDYSVGDRPIFYFHPLSKNMTFADEATHDTYQLDVDNDDLWADRCLPGLSVEECRELGVGADQVCQSVSAREPDYVKNTELARYIDTSKGIYGNQYLYATKNGGDRQLIAEMNRLTGSICYLQTQRASEVLSALYKSGVCILAQVGIFLPDSSGTACPIENSGFPCNVFSIGFEHREW